MGWENEKKFSRRRKTLSRMTSAVELKHQQTQNFPSSPSSSSSVLSHLCNFYIYNFHNAQPRTVEENNNSDRNYQHVKCARWENVWKKYGEDNNNFQCLTYFFFRCKRSLAFIDDLRRRFSHQLFRCSRYSRCCCWWWWFSQLRETVWWLRRSN